MRKLTDYGTSMKAIVTKGIMRDLKRYRAIYNAAQNKAAQYEDYIVMLNYNLGTAHSPASRYKIEQEARAKMGFCQKDLYP